MGTHSSCITDLNLSRLRDRTEVLNPHHPRLTPLFLNWAVDISHLLRDGFLETFDSKLRWLKEVEVRVVCVWFDARDTRPGRLVLLYESLMDYLRANPPEEPPRPSFAVVVSAVILLALVYLTGNVDWGGSKAYSRSSLDFRDIYVAIVLFLGAYVWIKFREVTFKGVYSRKLKDQRGRITKVVHEPRFKPPRENGTIFKRIYLGQYATQEEASILYRIAAYYYHENQSSSLDLEDGRWISIPPMSEEERNLTGLEKSAWVQVQVMKVYEEFKMAEATAALEQEFLEAWEDEVPQEQDEGVAVTNGHSLGSQEGSAIQVSHPTPNTQSGMGISSSHQLDLFPALVRTQQELITCLQQKNSLTEQLQDCWAQISELKRQHYLQQLLQDINEGVPSNEVEMEQSMHLQNHQSLMTLPYAGAEGREAFI